jgi:hypothetical protein
VAVADHFAWEEKHCFPYIPESIRRRLKSQHDALRAANFPRAAVLLHAEMEMTWFQRWCPQFVAQIEADHEHYRRTGE